MTRQGFARAVEGREPVGQAQVFPADVGRLFFFSEVAGAEGAGEVRHVWLHGGREMASVALAVRGPTWRTWSSKAILPEWRGEWTVEVRDASGNLLATGTCTVE